MIYYKAWDRNLKAVTVTFILLKLYTFPRLQLSSIAQLSKKLLFHKRLNTDTGNIACVSTQCLRLTLIDREHWVPISESI